MYTIRRNLPVAVCAVCDVLCLVYVIVPDYFKFLVQGISKAYNFVIFTYLYIMPYILPLGFAFQVNCMYLFIESFLFS